MDKSRAILALLFVLGVFVGALLGYFGKSVPGALPTASAPPDADPLPPDFHIKPFSSPVDAVVSMTYSAENFLLTAQRSNLAFPFAVQITYADARKPRQCLASDDLGAQLEKLTLIRTKQALQAADFSRMFPERLGALEIRDTLGPGAPAPMEFHATADKRAIAVRTGDFVAEAELSIEVFTRLESGCQP
jgi:hypothetical protein